MTKVAVADQLGIGKVTVYRILKTRKVHKNVVIYHILTYNEDMPSNEWTVKLSTIKLTKLIKQLPEHVRLKVFALAKNLESNGPMQPGWPNFSKLGNNSYHCHIKKGKPTYVVCWRVLS